MKIGLVSDTHIPTSLKRLPDTLIRELKNVDAILHAGDIVSPVVLDLLSAIAPTTAVTGNMDPPELRAKLSDRAILQFGNHTIGLKHGHQSHGVQSHYIGLGYDEPEMDVFYQIMASQLPGADIIVFGHFHRPVIKQWKDILFINPGAVAPTHGASSFALLTLGKKVDAQIVSLS